MTQLANDRPAQKSSGRPKAAKKAAPRTAAEPHPSKPRADPPEQPEEAVEAAMGLDMLLVDAARGPLRRMVPPAGTTLRFGSALARRPGTVAKRAAEFVKELAAIAAGRSELEPGRKD